MPKIEMGKQYKTRSGLPVRVIAIDEALKLPVVAIVDGYVRQYTIEGRGHEYYTADFDLIEVKPRIKREYWVNVYSSGIGPSHDSKEEADREAVANRIACVPIIIDCEEGEGLV